MAFKRTNFNNLSTKKKEFFASSYKFSKKTDFKEGDDVYIIPLGLESGYYETPCHLIYAHKVNGQLIGYNGSIYNIYVKCEGRDAEGNRHDALCCTLAQKGKEKFPSQNDAAKRVVGPCTNRVHIPVLILGNSLKEPKRSYPIMKVSILNELKSEAGLRFAYLEMSAYGFGQSIVKAYGTKLKEEGILDYELEDDSEEFLNEVRTRLSETIIKVHGINKPGFGLVKEYSFFPFSNPAIASQSPVGEKEAIIGYKKNKEIMSRINEFLTLFDVEIDNIVPSWDEKTLQEYFNSAMGLSLKAGLTSKKEPEEQQAIEVIETAVGERELSEEDMNLLDSLGSSEDAEPVQKPVDDIEDIETDLQDFEYDTEGEGEFFAD